MIDKKLTMSQLFGFKLFQHITRQEPVVFENTAIFNKLYYDPSNVPGIMEATMFSALELQLKMAEHSGEIATL